MIPDYSQTLSRVKLFVELVNGEVNPGNTTLERQKRGIFSDFIGWFSKPRRPKRPKSDTSKPEQRPTRPKSDTNKLEQRPTRPKSEISKPNQQPTRQENYEFHELCKNVRPKRSFDDKIYNNHLPKLPKNVAASMPSSFESMKTGDWNDINYGVNSLFFMFLLMQMFKFKHVESKKYLNEICYSIYPDMLAKVS